CARKHHSPPALCHWHPQVPSETRSVYRRNDAQTGLQYPSRLRLLAHDSKFKLGSCPVRTNLPWGISGCRISPAEQSSASPTILHSTRHPSGLLRETELRSLRIAAAESTTCTKRRPARRGRMTCCSQMAMAKLYLSGLGMAGSSSTPSLIRRPSGISGCCR